MSLNSKTRRRNLPVDSAVPGGSPVETVVIDADSVDLVQLSLSPSAERRSPTPICFTLNLEGVILAVNCSGAERLGYRVDQLVGAGLIEILHPSDRHHLRAYLADLTAQQAACHALPAIRYLCQSGDLLRVEIMAQPLYGGDTPPTLLLLGSPLDSDDAVPSPDNRGWQSADLSAGEQTRQVMLEWTAKFTHQIQQSLDSQHLLSTAVTQLQQQFQVDRVLVYRTHENGTGSIVAEAVSNERMSLVGRSLPDAVFLKADYPAYALGQVQAIADIDQAPLLEELRAKLHQLQVRAMLVVPIVRQETLWGLLVAHQSTPRHWPSWEVDLMSQLANHLATLLYQSELYGQVQHLNTDLEQQIRHRTAQLDLAFEFEATLKRITDKVRDSLDEDQILQVVVQELATVIKVSSCNAALYDLDDGTTTVRYEYTTFLSPYHGRTSKLADFAEIYDPLLRGQWLQFCSLTPNPVRGYVATLVTPIVDDQGVLGDLWLVNHKYYAFSEQDIRMAQQVANQCAIALRQARLYQASQAQIEELEKLNQLKDDFLSTVSHELRTPMANIKMAIQMLEICLTQSGTLAVAESRVSRYFKILRDESQREISLINDLLDLSRLNVGAEGMTMSAIDLPSWLRSMVHPFEERAHSQQQQLELSVPAELPKLVTDVSKLQRIVAELLTNACKYTPAGEQIHVAVTCPSAAASPMLDGRKDDHHNRTSKGAMPRQLDVSGLLLSAPALPCVVQIRIVNTGVVISPMESDRVFDKFYRIPNHDPWQHGGIGLGLALVRKLVEQLQGRIYLESHPEQTCFTLELPLQLQVV